MREELAIIDRILAGTASLSDRARLAHIHAAKAASLKRIPRMRPNRSSPRKTPVTSARAS